MSRTQVLPYGIEYINNELNFKGISFAKIVKKFGTPTIIFMPDTLRENIHHIKEAFSSHFTKFRINYALKACYLKEVVHIVRDEGLDIEILSDMEYHLCKQFGFKDKQIIFNGCAKLDRELHLVIKNGIKCINCDSLSEVMRVSKIAKKYGKIVDIGLRVQPPLDSSSLFVRRGEKLGVDIKSGEALTLIKLIKKIDFVRLIGINCHILANEVSPNNHCKLMGLMCDFFNKIKKEISDLRFIDLGGGFNSNYLVRREGYTMNMFAAAIAQVAKRNYFTGELIIEPGRYVVNDVFSALSSVVTKKKSLNNIWVILDIGTNLLIPTKHNRFNPISCILSRKGEMVNFGDGIGSTSGIIARESYCSRLEEGDFACVLNCGAYTVSMSENFVYAKPKIVQVNNKGISMIYKDSSFDSLSIYE